ncbi:hypothetical protein [Mycobacterium heckeshornense]|uniref:hypothetical protein n=1 Tax=Mycobacterium heckeshornense TaxID=110505 RepID=UPI0019411ED7|nr:hypothetical protein [Mycobacterium heckeshornense]
MAVPIYEVEITARINAKINSKHGITADEVLEVCYSTHHVARWHNDPKHGWRLLVKGRTERGRMLRIILHPVDVELGRWRLKTAIAENRQ